MTDDAGEMAREYQFPTGSFGAVDLFRWAAKHTDRSDSRRGGSHQTRVPGVHLRYDEETPALSYARTPLFERRLRQAVREGNGRATPFPPQFWYGVYDLEAGYLRRLAAGFAILRDRLLATRRIEAADLAQLPIGQAAAKLERSDGTCTSASCAFPYP